PSATHLPYPTLFRSAHQHANVPESVRATAKRDHLGYQYARASPTRRQHLKTNAVHLYVTALLSMTLAQIKVLKKARRTRLYAAQNPIQPAHTGDPLKQYAADFYLHHHLKIAS